MPSRHPWLALASLLLAHQLGCGSEVSLLDTSATEGAGSAAGTSTSSSANVPECWSNGECAEAEFCDYPDGLCGRGAGGVCLPLYVGCAPGPLICGCDGSTHLLDCNGLAGVSANRNASECPAPDGLFACGSGYCSIGRDYCRVTRSSDTPAGGERSECLLLPIACQGLPSCPCVAGEGCYDSCLDEAGAVTVGCTIQ